MKKLLKFIGSIAAIGAGVAGGLFLYSKIKERKEACEDDDMYDDYDDDFSDDDDETDSERSYVDLDSAKEAASDVVDDIKDAAKDVADEVKDVLD